MEGSDLEKIKTSIVLVRGQPLKVMLEQSLQRRTEYGQYARPLDQLREETEAEAHKWEPCGRTLRTYAEPTWQELGKPGPNGWEWNAAVFTEAQLPTPSFLAPSVGEPRDNQ